MRPDDPEPSAIRALVDRIFPRTVGATVERMDAGVSTHVYRVRRGNDTFYLRVLPEVGDGFAPEVRVHALLRRQGVLVPEVVYFEHRNERLGKSVMVATEIAGRSLAQTGLDTDTHGVLIAAGRDLAVINSIPVAGFGWINRDRGRSPSLDAEHPSHRAWARAELAEHLPLVRAHALGHHEIARIEDTIARHDAWLDAGPAHLAHGDFDVSHVYQQGGRYTGIIDFGEIRGTDPWYDLGHFRLRDGETIPAPLLPWLLEGYRSVTLLPDDHMQRIAFASLLIGLRVLARSLVKHRMLAMTEARLQSSGRSRNSGLDPASRSAPVPIR